MWLGTCHKSVYETPTIKSSHFHFERLSSSRKTVSHTCRVGKKANLLQADGRFAFLKSKGISKFKVRQSKPYRLLISF